MEQIITVKQEPTESSSNTIVNTTQVTGNAQSLQGITTPTTPQSTITLVKVENVQPSNPAGAATPPQAAAKPISIMSTASQPTSPQVQRVFLSGSPVKITQIKPARTDAGHVLPAQALQLQPGQPLKGNVTFVQVHKVNPTAKQPIAVKATGSPNKQGQPFHVQKILPISLATTLPASQVVTQTVTIASSNTGVVVRSIAPKMNIAPAPSVTQTMQLAPKPTMTQVTGSTPQGQQQRFIIPAITPNISNTNTNLQFPHGVISGGVVYLPQQALASGGFPIAVPLTANTFTQETQQNTALNGTSPDSSPPTRPRKPCNCTKSQCLKLYCDCFAQGEFCNNCNCINCSNNMEHEKERSKAIKACLDRNPHAFHPKIGKGKVGESERRHNKGCHCKRSGCLKNYCECYEAKILCTSLCKCTGCKNFEESPERKTLMHLADAAEVRVNQQNAAKTKLESQIEDLPTRPSIKTSSGERLPFSFVTNDVVQATCQCLVAQAADAEKIGLSPALTESMILEEFGRSLLQIIHTASKTKAQP